MIRKHSKKLKKDGEFSRRIQLIQDLDFPEASLRIAFTPDQQHVVATGVYKPQFRIFELAETAMKFERHTVAETVAMQILSDDWRKLVLLQSDRYVEFHSPSGVYHSTRIPKMGRDMVYDKMTCDLVLAASSNEVYRLNLDRGQFMAPFESGAEAVNCVRISPLHGVYGLACDNGTVEFWDRRDRRRMNVLQIARTTDFSLKSQTDLEVTALHFLPDGLHWAAGTSDGRVLLFDLRSNQPLDIDDHYNGFAIKKIDYHLETGLLVSSDKRSIKFWKTPHTREITVYANSSSHLFTTIESEHDINDFAMQQGTGLLLVANETSPVSSYFIPTLGPAPRWCSFLENLTEEMEEKNSKSAAIYDNFKFVTKTELAQLGLDHLVGTNLLRAYMHGYFIDLRLYEKAKAIANPFAYEEYLARRKQEKLEKEQQSRIRARDPAKSAKVNRLFAEKLAKDQDDEDASEELDDKAIVDSKDAKKKKRARETAKVLLKDDRFTDLFNNPEFEIDQESSEYRNIHPSHQKH
jgi:ribosome biogenesis protein ENP2